MGIYSYEDDTAHWLRLDADGNETDDSVDPLMPHMTDLDIWGLADSYDDARISKLIQSYLELRRQIHGSVAS